MIKAVIPAAGMGTRFLPVTKSMPKEMLPIVDKPVIQFIVEEAARAGITDVLMITGRNKRALEDHFDRLPCLEEALEKKGETLRLAEVTRSSGLANIHYLRQGDPLGLGHAILLSRRHVGEEPFAVLLGDDLIDEEECLLEELIAVQKETGGSVVALMEVEPEQIGAYGCAAVRPVSGRDYVRITDLMEKPTAFEAPSNLAVIGRYVLSPAIFEVLEMTAPGRDGEVQLTDALRMLTQTPEPGGGVFGVVYRGRRFDTGDKLSYIKAVVSLALERGDLGSELRKWLQENIDSSRPLPVHAKHRYVPDGG